MLRLTRFNGTELFVNPELIITVESTPDTVITLTTGEKLVIKEKTRDVVDQFMEYKRFIHTQANRLG